MAHPVKNVKATTRAHRAAYEVEGACSQAWTTAFPTNWRNSPSQSRSAHRKDAKVAATTQFDRQAPSSSSEADHTPFFAVSTASGTVPAQRLVLVGSDFTPNSQPLRGATMPEVQLGAVAYALPDEEEIPDLRVGFMSELSRQLMDEMAEAVAGSVETCFAAAEAASRHSSYSMLLAQYGHICERAPWNFAEVANRTSSGPLQAAMLSLFERSTAPASRTERFQEFASQFGIRLGEIAFRTEEHLAALRFLVVRSDDTAVGALLAQTAFEAAFSEAYCRHFTTTLGGESDHLRYWATNREELMKDLLIIADAITRGTHDLDEVRSAIQLVADSWCALINRVDVLE